MQLVHKRHAGSAGFAAIRAEQPPPLRLDGPSDLPLGMRLAQRRNSGHGMKDVAHRAQTHHEQTQLLWLWQSSIFSWGLLQFAHPQPPEFREQREQLFDCRRLVG